MQIAPPGEFNAPKLFAEFKQIFLGLHRLGLGLVAAPGNQFLPDVRRIADDGI